MMSVFCSNTLTTFFQGTRPPNPQEACGIQRSQVALLAQVFSFSTYSKAFATYLKTLLITLSTSERQKIFKNLVVLGKLSCYDNSIFMDCFISTVLFPFCLNIIKY